VEILIQKSSLIKRISHVPLLTTCKMELEGLYLGVWLF